MRYSFLLVLMNLHVYELFKIGDVKRTNLTQHLGYERVKKACSQIDTICKINGTNVCAVRSVNKKMEYKSFINSCYLYMSNMCDNPGKEYSIIEAGSCVNYFKSRRDGTKRGPIRNNDTNSETKKVPIIKSSTANVKRARPETTISTLYDIETAYDNHICPMSCPNTYSPICIAVNRGHGMYFKFYTFVNHCAGDLYYCKHWEDFSPPPDEGELVNSSPLSWSYCAANKYIQFARFSEVTASMGYYGWLAGDHKYSHIMEPHERIPGYG